ncbi:MBL fold metallo-hydrolase [Agrococcus jejuensis]|uniref:Glyoxylase, beta-lactamase superfamily II n=1 Tax=Agrococcus jejuensis TaxID=399736 RepID=A0A1G8BE78_9MICO|nr:MBL fold metallo-hydrolase [Agrococcus jejuensis]SDH31537.1 Glyoxylase, beta-lactamase superfamily II [Agrococcus jejuensis]
MQLAPGLHRIGDDRVAFLLVVADDGLTLVDAGLPGHRRDLRRALRALDRTEADVRGVVLTHGDQDHIGFAEALRVEHGVPVYVHEADAARTRGDEPAPSNPMPPWRLGAALGFVATMLTKGIRPRHLGEVRTVVDGDVLPLPGSPVVVGMPGHSPGSIAVLLPEHRVVAVGDALTTRHVLTGDTTPQLTPFTDDLAEADASLARLAQVDADVVVPGHGTVWRGTPRALVDAIRAAR